MPIYLCDGMDSTIGAVMLERLVYTNDRFQLILPGMLKFVKHNSLLVQSSHM